jgi:hypothetical protein
VAAVSQLTNAVLTPRRPALGRRTRAAARAAACTSWRRCARPAAISGADDMVPNVLTSAWMKTSVGGAPGRPACLSRSVARSRVGALPDGARPLTHARLPCPRAACGIARGHAAHARRGGGAAAGGRARAPPLRLQRRRTRLCACSGGASLSHSLTFAHGVAGSAPAPPPRACGAPRRALAGLTRAREAGRAAAQRPSSSAAAAAAFSPSRALHPLWACV